MWLLGELAADSIISAVKIMISRIFTELEMTFSQNMNRPISIKSWDITVLSTAIDWKSSTLSYCLVSAQSSEKWMIRGKRSTRSQKIIHLIKDEINIHIHISILTFSKMVVLSWFWRQSSSHDLSYYTLQSDLHYLWYLQRCSRRGGFGGENRKLLSMSVSAFFVCKIRDLDFLHTNPANTLE